MRRLPLVIISSFCALTGYTQSIDPASVKAASWFTEARQASIGQKVWNIDLYGPILFVDEQSRATWANEPDTAGILKPDGKIYKGVLPADVMTANTAINWQGKRWSVIEWPLPENRDDRVNLILHECFHRIQHRLGLPERGPTVSHLSSMDGRIYFLLELQALKAALGKPVRERGADLANALLFREKRRSLFPGTFEKERILEMSEGLAEYTGVILGRQRDSIRPHLYQQIDSTAGRKSLIRSCAYITGPVYGYLLYEKAPQWTSGLDSNASFPMLVSKYYQIAPPKTLANTRLTAAIDKYNGTAIIQSEKLKEQEHQKLLHQYIDMFTRQPVLTIELVKMNVSFNPNNLFDLGEYGTIYPTGEVKDIWGQLDVEGGGMLMKDWKVVRLSLTADQLAKDQEAAHIVTGRGWKITLNKGWKIIRLDELNYKIAQGD